MTDCLPDELLMIDPVQNRWSTPTCGKGCLTFCAISILLVLLHLAIPGVALSADAEKVYSYGKRAVERGKWTTAARSMVESIEADPREKKRGLGSPYIPHFYLGLSLSELGDCELATRSLTRSRQYNVIQKTRYLSQLEQIESSCRARSETLSRVRLDLQSGLRLADKLEAKTDDPRLASFWNRGSPVPIEQFREARRGLERSETILESEGGVEISKQPRVVARLLTDDQISESNRTASHAVDLLRALDEAAREYEQEAVATRPELLDDVLEKRLQAVRAWNATPTRVRQSSDHDLSAEFQRLTTAHLGNREVTIEELETVRNELSEFLEELDVLAQKRPSPMPAPSRQAPAVLRQAAEAYFGGDYEQVLTVLDGAAFSESQEQAQLHLFRAAALYSLYLVGEQPDPSLLSGAQWNVRSCLEANATFEPLTEAFSPRFIDFFRQQSSMEARRQ